jgi:poly(3-hydroxybutyrate) depolymerase
MVVELPPIAMQKILLLFKEVIPMFRVLGLGLSLAILINAFLGGDNVHADGSQMSKHRKRVQFKSSLDGSTQEAMLITPRLEVQVKKSIPLVVSLHSWSADLEQRNDLEELVHHRGWMYLFPNFRGANRTTQACGSDLAQQDILDSISWVIDHYQIDKDRIYLTGTSGGGHMTMLMAARHPKLWRAASAWVGISDLVEWHAKHSNTNYGNMIEQCCGGAPGDSLKVDAQYKSRSPITYFAGAREVAIDICAGINDGHQGSVPISHSINAFNMIAEAKGDRPVTETEISQLSRPGKLEEAQAGDEGFDGTFGRKYFLRRRSGNARLTIFDGGHEGIASATIAWFENHP